MKLPKIRIVKTFPSGAWQCTAMTATQLITMNYFFYTKKEALQEFRAHLREVLK